MWPSIWASSLWLPSRRSTSSNDPTPLTEEEVYAMGVEKKEIIVNYAVGDTVRILDADYYSLF